MKRARIAIAIAFASMTGVTSIACVSVPDSIKTTFAPHQGAEADNYAANAPHSTVPAPDVELTQATVPGPEAPDASTSAPFVVRPGMEGLCARDPSPVSTDVDGGSPFASWPTTGMRNCLQDAGNQ